MNLILYISWSYSWFFEKNPFDLKLWSFTFLFFHLKTMHSIPSIKNPVANPAPVRMNTPLRFLKGRPVEESSSFGQDTICDHQTSFRCSKKASAWRSRILKIKKKINIFISYFSRYKCMYMHIHTYFASNASFHGEFSCKTNA